MFNEEKPAEKLGIGIDTGGTYTDSVIAGLQSGDVISKAKALTTPQDLGRGIRASLEQLDAALFADIALVALSTTLATNSVVEGTGARVGLIMAVPNPDTFVLPRGLPCEETILIPGSHTAKGDVGIPLDEGQAAQAVHRLAPMVDAFAVCGYLSIYNAGHEIALRQIIQGIVDRPVVCAHELSGTVGMLERASTAALNARLLPVIRELIGAVEDILDSLAIRAPLMVVKGDGSMMSAAACRGRPVETVLSGPAASIAGACRLSGMDNALVLDMGGTTTDMAVVSGGQARVSREGARVGNWQTRVRAVDMWTLGLGGDSLISLDAGGRLSIGPRRVISFCMAGSLDAELTSRLKALLRTPEEKLKSGRRTFFTLRKRPRRTLSASETSLVEGLDGRVLDLESIGKTISPFIDVNALVRQGILIQVGFTPTDFLHAGGQCGLWNAAAADAGLLLLSHLAGESPPALQKRIRDELDLALALNIAAKALQEDESISEGWDESCGRLLKRLVGRDGGRLVSTGFQMNTPVVAVGAPVHAHLPGAAQRLRAELIIPPHAEVANAYGAVTGKVVQSAAVLIRPAALVDGYVLIAPGLQAQARCLEDAIRLAGEHAAHKAAALVTDSGGAALKTDLAQETFYAPLADGWGKPVLLEVKVTATACGSPGPVQAPGPALSTPIAVEGRKRIASLRG